jgi:cGMP-dependent protein kinase
LKCIRKSQIVKQNLEKYLNHEKQVCEMVDFPFCMRFLKTFKDDHHIFFLLEYIKGLELFDAIREIGLLGTYDSQFYISQMILSIEYLHNQKIIYRDIKPENIMVDEKGYIKLIDMGTAKILSVNYGVSRTFTIIGTPHYMAPEIINGKGYSLFIDLWSIGICLFEFMCGYVPFGDDAEDPY